MQTAEGPEPGTGASLMIILMMVFHNDHNVVDGDGGGDNGDAGVGSGDDDDV